MQAAIDRIHYDINWIKELEQRLKAKEYLWCEGSSSADQVTPTQGEMAMAAGAATSMEEDEAPKDTIAFSSSMVTFFANRAIAEATASRMRAVEEMGRPAEKEQRFRNAVNR